MKTRRNTSDLAQSYLDLLSNGLGAVIILYMILVGVRAPTPYASQRSHREAVFGRIDTYRGLPPDAKHEIANLYVVQLVVRTSDPSIRPTVASNSPEADASTRILRGIGDPPGRTSWLVLRDRLSGGPWSIQLTRKVGDLQEIPVLVYASLGSAVLEPKLESVAPGEAVARFQDAPKGSVYIK